MDKFEDTVVNPNLSMTNFEVRVHDAEDIPKRPKITSPVTGKKDKNYQKSIVLLILLAGILAYQLLVSF